MNARELWLLVGLSIAAVGCAEEAEEVPPVAEVETAPVVTPAPDAGMAGTENMGMGNTVQLQPLNNSGVMGEATLTEMGGQTQVMVRLTSAPQGEHAGHIHQGTCDSPGSVVAPLQPISVGADGTGTMTTTVDVPMMTVMNGQHIVVYHEAGGSPGQPVVCGSIPAHTM